MVAGTEQVVKDAFLLFWDIGSGKMLGGYWESYGDDITTVAFHPEDADKLATGGTDGLINVFDVSQSNEDDALLTSINTESSVKELIWYKVRCMEIYSCLVSENKYFFPPPPPELKLGRNKYLYVTNSIIVQGPRRNYCFVP